MGDQSHINWRTFGNRMFLSWICVFLIFVINGTVGEPLPGDYRKQRSAFPELPEFPGFPEYPAEPQTQVDFQVELTLRCSMDVDGTREVTCQIENQPSFEKPRYEKRFSSLLRWLWKQLVG